MPNEISIPVRGANGINLLVHSTGSDDPANIADLQSGSNIDLSLERAVMPRRGLARVTVWNGLTFDSNGDLRTAETVMPAFGRQVISLIPNAGLLTDPPAALGV